MARLVVRATILYLALSAGLNPAWAIPPTAVDDEFTGTEDIGVGGNVVGNDISSSGAPLTVVGHTGPAGVVILADGTLKYTPPADFSGEVIFDYTVREDELACLVFPTPIACFDDGQVTLLVEAVADAPTLATGSVTGDEDDTIPLNITMTPVDTDGSQTLTATVSGLPFGSSLTAGVDQGGGIWTMPAASLNGLGFIPPADLNGSGSLAVLVDVLDEAFTGGGLPINQDATSVNGSVNVTINPVNDQPTVDGVIPVITTDEEVDVSVDLSGLFGDVDTGAQGTLTLSVTDISLAAIDTAVMSGTSLDITLLVDAVGSGTVEVTANDGGAPSLSASATINVTVNPVNDDPFVAGAIAPVVVDEDAANSNIDLTGLFDDPDIVTSGDSLTLSVVSATAGLFDSAAVSGQTLTLAYAENQNGNGTVTVMAEDTGTPALSATYDIDVTVSPVNDQPTVEGVIPDVATNEDVGVAVDLTGLFDDVDILTNGDSLALSVTNISHAAIDTASMAVNTLNITVLANQIGTGTVEVTATDSGTPGLSVSATINVEVNEQNDPPVVVGAVAPIVVDEDSPLAAVSLAGLFDDPDIATSGDSLSLSVDSTAGAFFDTVGISGQTLSFSFLADQNGVGSVTVMATDTGTPALTETYAISVTVNPVNDAPVISGPVPSVTTDEDTGFSVDLTNVFDDADILTNADTLSLSVTSVDNPAIDTAAIAGTQLNVGLFANLFAAGSVDVTATDGGTPALSVTAVINITVTPVNDAPVVVGSVGPVVVDEDAPNSVFDISGLFDDADIIPAGDSLSVAVSNVTNSGVFASAAVVGSDLVLDYADEQNGLSAVTITATDTGTPPLSVDHVVSVTVNSVNDAPVLTGSLADINADEDDPPTLVTIDVFDDVDIATNADVLTYSVSTNTNPAMFAVASITGDTLTLDLAPDANGSADITVRATDLAGIAVEDTFTINVTGVNDIPAAADDALTVDEDPGPLTISVLDNDYLAEQPTTITAVGPSGEHVVVDAFDDPVVFPNGQVSIDGTDLIYEPTSDYYGVDTFTYTITDVNGDTSTASVTVTVNPVNDPPIGVQVRDFHMFESQALVVPAANGVLLGSYDVDAKRLDEFGNEIGGVMVAQLQLLPSFGVLVFDGSDGSFVYTPPNDTTGNVEFSYRLFDNEALSESPEYLVRIEIDSLPPAPEAPTPGEVATNFNLAQVPLEQSATVPPNVMVVMDTSGSMDWNLVVAGNDENGGFLLDNSAIARRPVETSYSYLWDLDTNTYPSTSSFGFIVPTEDALRADGGHDDNTNLFGVWRARSSEFNTLYYDPETFYEPWIGQDEDNLDFVDADPEAIRLNPVDPDDTFDMLELHSYGSSNVPNWLTRGGSSRVDVDDLYIPFYYETAASAPLLETDAYTRKVEILPANAPFPGGANRDDCRDDGDPLECTYDQEIQNFANWFQYYRNREFVTKGSIGNVVAEVQDIRVGYETVDNPTSEDIAHMNDLYSEGEKKELLDNIYAVDSFGGTPLRQMLGRASRILGCQIAGDCPALPEPEGQCQQNFILLFSDGYWNGGTGVSDNTDINDPMSDFDGGRYADDVSQTLADVAMEFYENDLFPLVDDEVPVGSRDVSGAVDGYFDGVDSMHQHVKTYAIAFGASGTITPSTAKTHPVGNAFGWTDPFDGNLEKIDDMLHASINGRGDYLSAGNPAELQAAFEAAFLEFTQAASSASAAAFNSTSLRDGTLLYRGFYDLRDRTGELTATEVDNSGNLADTPTWLASEQLDPASILPSERKLVTYNPAVGGGVPFTFANLTVDQQTTLNSAQLDYIRGERGDEEPTGTLREREPLGSLLGPIVNSSPVFVGTPRAINRDQSPFPTDDLYSDFVDDVGSRTPVVYVGGNDGIMHGFSAETGLEVYGFLPNKILDASVDYSNKLNDFTSPFYLHKYYVDLSPRLNDVYMRPSASGSKQWITSLVGGLGAGGKGMFALNVTDPDYADASAAADTVLWEFTDDDDTYPVNASGVPLGGAIDAVVDPDGDPVRDLGVSLSQPLVQMTNHQDGGTPARNEWAAIFGNGINSTAGIAKLFVLFMDRGLNGWGDADDFVKIDTGFGVPLPGEQLEGYPNGLGSPTSIDADLNGTVDYVYAGDRIGNLFRFDMTSDDPDDWHAVRLFTATYNDGVQDVVQPIQSRPLVVKNPDGVGFIVIVGTGSLVTSDDSSSTEIQSIYGVWDRLTSNPATALDETKTLRLVEQTITNVVDDSTDPAVTRRTVTANAVEYVAESDVPGTYGWYIDLDMPRATNALSGAVNLDETGQAPPDPQYPGEKAVRRLVFRNGAVITTTVLPATDATSCFGARPGSILVFDAFNGGDAVQPIIDFNNDGVVDEGDLVSVGGVDYSAGLLFNQSDLDGSLVDLSTLGGEGDTDFLFVSGGNDTVSYRIRGINDGKTGRLSWVELDDAD